MICDEVTLERKVQRLTRVIRGEIDTASTLNDRIQGDLEAEQRYAQYVQEIETWRDRVTEMLRRELPSTGADIRFLTATGQTGQGQILYEKTRLIVLRGNLATVLDNLHSYAQRAR